MKVVIRQKLDDLGGIVPPTARGRVLSALESATGLAVAVIAGESDMVMSRAMNGEIRDVPLGFSLLADSGVRWYGELDLNDEDAMAILEARRALVLSRRQA